MRFWISGQSPKVVIKRKKRMMILVTNKAWNEFHYEDSWAAHQGCASIFACFGMIFILCRYGLGADYSVLFSTILLTLLSVAMALYNLEIYLLNKCATETISVQHEFLVLEYHKLMFRHRKEIPLSAITGVEFCDYENRDVRHPYTLRVVHSGGQSYHIGISMTQEDARALATRIVDLLQRYI